MSILDLFRKKKPSDAAGEGGRRKSASGSGTGDRSEQGDGKGNGNGSGAAGKGKRAGKTARRQMTLDEAIEYRVNRILARERKSLPQSTGRRRQFESFGTSSLVLGIVRTLESPRGPEQFVGRYLKEHGRNVKSTIFTIADDALRDIVLNMPRIDFKALIVGEPLVSRASGYVGSRDECARISACCDLITTSSRSAGNTVGHDIASLVCLGAFNRMASGGAPRGWLSGPIVVLGAGGRAHSALAGLLMFLDAMHGADGRDGIGGKGGAIDGKPSIGKPLIRIVSGDARGRKIISNRFSSFFSIEEAEPKDFARALGDASVVVNTSYTTFGAITKDGVALRSMIRDGTAVLDITSGNGNEAWPRSETVPGAKNDTGNDAKNSGGAFRLGPAEFTASWLSTMFEVALGKGPTPIQMLRYVMANQPEDENGIIE